MRSQVLGRPCPAGVSAAARRGALLPPPAGFTAMPMHLPPALRGGFARPPAPGGSGARKKSQSLKACKIHDEACSDGGSGVGLPRDLIGTRAVFRQSELSSGFRRGKGKEEADERVNGTEGSTKGRRERSPWHCEYTKQNELV